MYRELVRYFSARALFEDASWAAYRASIQQHRLLRQNLSLSVIRANQLMKTLMPNMMVVRRPAVLGGARCRWVSSRCDVADDQG